MAATSYMNEYLSHWNIPELIQYWYLEDGPHIDLGHQKAAADLKIPSEPKGRFSLDVEARSSQRFIVDQMMGHIAATMTQGSALIHARFITQDYLPADFPLYSSPERMGFMDMRMDDLIKAIRKHKPDLLPKDYKEFIAWMKAEVQQAAGAQIESAQTTLIDRIAQNVVDQEKASLAALAQTIPSLLELSKAHPEAIYDKHFTRAISRLVGEANKRAGRFGLSIDDDAFQNILYTPAFYASYNAAYKPFYERIQDNSAMEQLLEEAMQRGVGSFSMAKHPTLSLLHHTHPESKFDEGFHIHTRLMRNRIRTKAREHNIRLDEQLLDGTLYSVSAYRDYNMMALMKPASSYAFDDAKGFQTILDDGLARGIITPAQAQQLEQRRVLDVAEGNPFGTWDEHCKAIVAHGLIKSVKPIPELPQAKAPGRYASLGGLMEAARSGLAWLRGSKSDTRPNP